MLDLSESFMKYAGLGTGTERRHHLVTYAAFCQGIFWSYLGRGARLLNCIDGVMHGYAMVSWLHGSYSYSAIVHGFQPYSAYPH